MDSLLQPISLGELSLANRIVQDLSVAGAEPRALQPGLIGTKGVHPDERARGGGGDGARSDAERSCWRSAADAAHAAGSRIVMSLVHPGGADAAQSRPAAYDCVASSAVAPHDLLTRGSRPVARLTGALSERGVQDIVGAYRQAAMDAASVGMDGVELNAAGGFLPMQFLSTNTNLREDAYGGSGARRCRFVWDVLRAMGEAIGPGRVGVRIEPGGRDNGVADAVPAATYAALLRGMAGGGFAYVHLQHRPMRELDTIMLTRAYWSGPLIVSAGFSSDQARRLVAGRQIDAVVTGYEGFAALPDGAAGPGGRS